ncbi:mucin-19-like isoform X2 [Portunus trituberculatus]|uniref:mucin-19-like isoform X2 n=1 Tax=Portunus trituberculatus TaxID=210409 RepID=UPI001E1CF836|nr:mucin-19-like isoform X2 [Portunus trituberculatus]
MSRFSALTLVLLILSPTIHDFQIYGDVNVSLNRLRRQVGQQEPHMQPLLNPLIPTSIGHYLGADQAVDSCVRDEVLVKGGCHRLLTQGPCARDEYVVMDPGDLKGYCVPRLCAPDRIFVFSDQMCHDPKSSALCPPGRHLYQTAYGTPVCQCPDGTYEGDDDLDDDVCDPILGRTLSCPPNQVLWFTNFRMPPECLPDPCGGENLNRGPNDLPFVPSATDGKCYQLGQKPAVCPAKTWYSLALETLRGVCTDVEDAGYQVFDQETLAFLTEMYSAPIARDTTSSIAPGQMQQAGQGIGQSQIFSGQGAIPGQGVGGQGTTTLLRQGATGFRGQSGVPGQQFRGQTGATGQGFTTNLGQPGTTTGQTFTGSSGQGFMGQPGTTTGQTFTGSSGSSGQTGSTGSGGQRFTGQTGASGQGFTTNFGQAGSTGAGFRGQGGTTTSGQAGTTSQTFPGTTQGFTPQFTGQGFAGQGFAGQGFAGQGFAGQGFAGQGFAGQGFAGQGFTGQTFPGQSFPGQVFTGQAFPGQQFAGQQFVGQQRNNTSLQSARGFTGQVGMTPGQMTTSTVGQTPAVTYDPSRTTSTSTTTVRGQTTTTVFGQSSTTTAGPLGAPRGGSHRGHPPHITSRSRHQQTLPSSPSSPSTVTQLQPVSQHVPGTTNFQGFSHQQPMVHSRSSFHSPHMSQASPVLSPRMPMAPHMINQHGALIPGQPFFLSNEQQSLEMFGGPGAMRTQLGRSMSSHPGFSANPSAQGDLSVVMGQLLAQRNGVSGNSDLSFLQTPSSHPHHGFFNGVKTLMAGVLENPSFRHQQQHQQQHQHQQHQQHHRGKRSPLPHATPGNVFETRLVGCRAGAQRDINAKCRDTILPAEPPAKRSLRAVPPVPPRPGCPTGQAYDRRRRCAPLNDAVNSINAFNLGK